MAACLRSRDIADDDAASCAKRHASPQLQPLGASCVVDQLVSAADVLIIERIERPTEN